MKIKTKLTLGMGLLFILIIILSVIGVTQLDVLSKDTQNILRDNYKSLEYARQMLFFLDEIPADSEARKSFEVNLEHQLKNVTEKGEKEVTENLHRHFKKLLTIQKDSIQPAMYSQIRKDLNEIMRLNMDAIEGKSKLADTTAKKASVWIAVTGTLCFLIALTLLFNLPGNIANPIRQLTESIKNIAGQKYSERVHFEGDNEFGELARAFNTMASKLEEYAHSNVSRLLFEKKRIETLINNMTDPIIGLDEEQEILFFNEAAATVLGIHPQTAVGKKAQEVALHNDLLRKLTLCLIEHKNKIEKKSEPLKIYAGGKESYFMTDIISVDMVPTGENIPIHIGDVIVLKNVTSFKELDFAKTNFIATVSHELKTPISAIKMSVQLLDDSRVGGLNEEQQKLVKNIREDSERLLNITGELLNLSQVETGNIQLSIQPSDPVQVVQYSLDAVKLMGEQKKITIVQDLELPVVLVKADADKTAWVLINFLTNAIRYSFEGGKIYLTVKKEGNELFFSVKDEGKGIDPQYKEKIFERYFKVPGSSTAGTGLGLAISKEFIEAQQGSIGVKSEWEKGAEFFFTLPVAG